MKRVVTKTSGVSKGAPSGFVISLAVHAAAFLLAGMFVVFSVVQKEEKKFVPPKPVDRPKMKLKKPKVKVKKSSKPKSTTRIVTKVQKASMPDIQLPEMSGIGDGLAGDIGGFDIMPSLEDVSQFGSAESVGSDLEGTYYDFNRLRSGADCVTDPVALAGLVAKFLTKDWSPGVFSRYYRAPQKLYTTSIAMPPLQSTQAPEAFGEPNGQGWCWLVHYKGQLVHTEDIKFRFWGFGDDALAVRVDGELVLLSCFPQWVTDFQDHTEHLWQSSSADNEKYPMANHHSKVGDWIELKANEPLDLEILLGESHGGIFAAMLCVEVEGVEYERNPHRNGPTLPFFKTAEFTTDMTELIYSQLHPGEATCEMGPVFNDFSSVTATSRTPVVYENPIEPQLPVHADDFGPEMRTWTSTDNKQFEARYKTIMGSAVVLENDRKKQKQVPLSALSPDDREYVMLLNPPKFKIDLAKSGNQRSLPETTPWLDNANRRLQVSDYQFGARLKPTTVNNVYNHPLEVEYFVFGEETTGDNYVLLDRKSDIFVPSETNTGEFQLMGDDEVELKVQAVNDEGSMRGVQYGGYLVTVTDERGYIIQYKATHEFLYKHLENLKNVPLGKHFNESCNRVMPDRPKDEDRFTITL